MSESSHYIYVLRPTRTGMIVDGGTEAEKEIVSRHFNYLRKLTDQGTAILMGRTQETTEDTFGIVIFKASSEAEANEIMEGEPAVKMGVMSAELFKFRIALFNPAGAVQQG